MLARSQHSSEFPRRGHGGTITCLFLDPTRACSAALVTASPSTLRGCYLARGSCCCAIYLGVFSNSVSIVGCELSHQPHLVGHMKYPPPSPSLFLSPSLLSLSPIYFQLDIFSDDTLLEPLQFAMRIVSRRGHQKSIRQQ